MVPFNMIGESQASTTLTREELYRRVWQTPMYRLAAEFGITGRGLAKICARHGIPVPWRGWWARKAAGQRVAVLQLPAPEPDMAQDVTITRHASTKLADPEPPAPSTLKSRCREASSTRIAMSHASSKRRRPELRC
jgi:hypothetical protein